MGSKNKKRSSQKADTQTDANCEYFTHVFDRLNLRPADFKMDYGFGKSILSGQRIVWMNVTRKADGKKIDDKIGTNKKEKEDQAEKLLGQILKEF